MGGRYHCRSGPVCRSQSRGTGASHTHNLDFKQRWLFLTSFSRQDSFQNKTEGKEPAEHNHTTWLTVLLFLPWEAKPNLSPRRPSTVQSSVSDNGRGEGPREVQPGGLAPPDHISCHMPHLWSLKKKKTVLLLSHRFSIHFKSDADIFCRSESWALFNRSRKWPVFSHLVRRGSLSSSHPTYFQSPLNHKNQPQRKETIVKVLKESLSSWVNPFHESLYFIQSWIPAKFHTNPLSFT